MKAIEISRELFDNVFEGCVFNYVKGNVIHYSQPCVIMKGSWVESETNINDFFFDCKEWAFSKGYIISSGLTPVLGTSKDGWAEVFSSSTPLDGKLHTFKQLSEPEAVFKACEYIMEKTKCGS